jgi:hypothetical protein
VQPKNDESTFDVTKYTRAATRVYNSNVENDLPPVMDDSGPQEQELAVDYSTFAGHARDQAFARHGNESYNQFECYLQPRSLIKIVNNAVYSVGGRAEGMTKISTRRSFEFPNKFVTFGIVSPFSS